MENLRSNEVTGGITGTAIYTVPAIELTSRSVPMHVLRKTYATSLINAHTDSGIIINQMGHEDITTTGKFYFYNNKSMKEIVPAVENAISSSAF